MFILHQLHQGDTPAANGTPGALSDWMRSVGLRLARSKGLAALSRLHVSAVLVGLVLAGPAVAQGQFAGRHPAILVDIGTLTTESDFTVFMRKDVPEDLRRSALRTLWGLMKLPVSCHELCSEPEPAASDSTRVASEKLSVAAQ
jgi:hypothetical protein